MLCEEKKANPAKGIGRLEPAERVEPVAGGWDWGTGFGSVGAGFGWLQRGGGGGGGCVEMDFGSRLGDKKIFFEGGS